MITPKVFSWQLLLAIIRFFNVRYVKIWVISRVCCVAALVFHYFHIPLSLSVGITELHCDPKSDVQVCIV